MTWQGSRQSEKVQKSFLKSPENKLGLGEKKQVIYLWNPPSKSTLMLGKIEGKMKRGQQRKRWLDGITDSMDMNLSKFRKIVEDKEDRWAAVHGIAKSWT